jgi:hypothetical protein
MDGDGLPSCSAAEALERQEPFVNPTLANQALALLARLFRYGTVSYHGAFVSMSSIPCCTGFADRPEILATIAQTLHDKTDPACPETLSACDPPRLRAGPPPISGMD